MKGLGNLNLLFPFFPMKSRSERVHKMSPALGMFLALGQTYKKNLSVFDLGHFFERFPLHPNLGKSTSTQKSLFTLTVYDLKGEFTANFQDTLLQGGLFSNATCKWLRLAD